MVHFRFHSRFGLSIDASQRRIQIVADRLNFRPLRIAFKPRMAHRNRVAQHGRTELMQQQLCKRASRNPRSCFTSRSALENVARIMQIEFQRARKIGVARPRRRVALQPKLSAPSVSSTGSAFSQFAQSRFSMRTAIGAPIVFP